jgi:chemotaxis protein methyltransferase CheR
MAQLISERQLAQLSEFIERQMGWHYPPERWPDLIRGITPAARQFGFEDLETCIGWLLSSTLSSDQLKILVRHLSIGETYFFREPKSLEAFQQLILPQLIETRRKSQKRLKIWSAGCSTGEEAYSIAILLDRLKLQLQGWQITILATDVNPAALQRAAQGSYREWSFRGTPTWVKQGYFEQGADGRFALSPQIREKVHFTQLNLAQNLYPSFLNQTEALDVIFCRNVLMYFTPKLMQEIVERLHRALAPGGWLIVSPSEASHLLFSNFTKVDWPGTILYQKAEVSFSGQPQRPALLPPDPKVFPISKVTASENISASMKTAPLEAPLAPEAISQETALALAQRYANEGQLAEALTWCNEAITADKLNPRSHYLLATILAEQGQGAEAIKSFKRSLYLDPNFVLAHFALGNLIQQQEGNKKAGKHFQNALSLLNSLPPDELLPEAEGLTAGRLIEIIQKMV